MVVAVLALVVLALVTDLDGDPPGSADRDGSPSASGSERAQSTTTVAPPDIDEPRAPVDLAVVPTGDDPVELARWWAAAYTAHVGSDLPGVLADRLAPVTTGDLLAELAALPPAASYDAEPAAVEGVSHRTPVEDEGRVTVRVTVETASALAVYDLVLVPEPAGGAPDDGPPGWLVDEASRV